MPFAFPNLYKHIQFPEIFFNHLVRAAVSAVKPKGQSSSDADLVPRWMHCTINQAAGNLLQCHNHQLLYWELLKAAFEPSPIEWHLQKCSIPHLQPPCHQLWDMDCLSLLQKKHKFLYPNLLSFYREVRWHYTYVPKTNGIQTEFLHLLWLHILDFTQSQDNVQLFQE